MTSKKNSFFISIILIYSLIQIENWAFLEEKNELYSRYSSDKETLIQSLTSQSEKLKKLINSINEWEQNIDGGNAYGAIGQIQSQADKFVIERKTRKNLEKESLKFIELFNELIDVRSKLDELAKLINAEDKDDEKEVNLVPIVASANTEKSSLDSFEYFEVKDASDIKQISSLADVYGDSGYWRILYNANFDKLKDPSEIIPVGTVLMVPNLNITREFEF